jgi:NAD(P)-dependent dehydrogenase (short-subunit alcohol dehydrogenase family)
MRPLPELIDLSGRVGIVTGAGRIEGIGYAIASRLAESGAAVVINDVDDDAVAPALAALQEAGWNVRAVGGDVADPTTAERAVATAVESFGRVDILVNNAAIWPRAKLLDWTKESWTRVFDVNTTAPLLWTQAVVKSMVRQGNGGSIVNIISSAGQMTVMEELLGYESSKAATLHLTHGIANACGPLGVRVNNVIPGPIANGRTKAEGDVPLGRSGTPDEIALGVLFLASDLGSFVTGADWRIDGGRMVGPGHSTQPTNPADTGTAS